MFETEVGNVNAAVSALAQVAEQRVAKDAQTITSLVAQIDLANTSYGVLLAKYDLAQQGLLNDQAMIGTLQAQLAASSPTLRDLQKRPDWSGGQTGVGIGGKPPAAFSRTWDAIGNLIITTTGKVGEWDDELIALHLPGLISASTRYISVDYTVLFDANQSHVQCHEFDCEWVSGGLKGNGSHQIDNSKNGLLNIANGVGGGWLDTNVILGKLTPGIHTMRAEYAIDSGGKSFVYLAFTFDGKRYPLYKIMAAAEPETATTWRDGFLTLQLQEDINSLGGTVVTTYQQIAVTIL